MNYNKMFGFRTPVKPNRRSSTPMESPEMTEKVIPSKPPVRRSTGEKETGTIAAKPKTPTKAPTTVPTTLPAGPSKPKTKPAVPQECQTSAATKLFEACGDPSEEQTRPNRVAEARACLNRAKLHLGNSRNLRTDIKAEVTRAIERLYELVKEAEADTTNAKGSEREKEPKRSEGETPHTTEKEGNKANEELLNQLKENGKLLIENNNKIEKLSELLEKRSQSLEGTTYAGVAAGSTKQTVPEKSALHSVVVSSKDLIDTGEDVLKQVRETLQARDGWIRVEKVRKAKDQRVILGCETEEYKNRVKERLGKVANRLSVTDIKNKDPLLVLRDVQQYNSDDDIVDALKNQNKEFFTGLKTEDVRIEIRFRRKTRNPQTAHTVIRVSPALWNRMIGAGVAHIDLQKVRVEDFSPLVQCSLCLAYGHGRKYCAEKDIKCSHCGGQHMRTECADWLANATPSCCNCTRAKLDRTDHNAFSADCPVRRKWDALARASVAYS